MNFIFINILYTTYFRNTKGHIIVTVYKIPLDRSKKKNDNKGTQKYMRSKQDEKQTSIYAD